MELCRALNRRLAAPTSRKRPNDHTRPPAIATRLLVSRATRSAEIVLCAGVSLLDVKEPLAGLLGRGQRRRIAGSAWPPRASPTKRCEQRDARQSDLDRELPRWGSCSTTNRDDFRPASSSRSSVWLARGTTIAERQRAAVEGFPTEVSPVAVVYADAVRAARQRRRKCWSRDKRWAAATCWSIRSTSRAAVCSIIGDCRMSPALSNGSCSSARGAGRIALVRDDSPVGAIAARRDRGAWRCLSGRAGRNA